jgi:hypothetical protein
MITNIIDKRKRQYRFLKINAIVEAAYGRAIQPEVWEEIFEATSRYTIPESALQVAPTLKEIKPKLRAVLDASRLIRVSFPGPPVLHRNPLDTDGLKQDMPRASNGNLFELYVFLLDWLISYTEHIQSPDEERYRIGYQGSGRWQEWIRDLIQIMKRNGLPYGTSTSTILKFTILVRELQNQMKVDVHTKHTPPEKLTKQKELEILQLSKCIKHAQSDRALTDAIKRVLPICQHAIGHSVHIRRYTSDRRGRTLATEQKIAPTKWQEHVIPVTDDLRTVFNREVAVWVSPEMRKGLESLPNRR